MLRLNKNALKMRNGQLVYKSSPFTGIAFSMEEGKLIEAKEFLKGIAIKQYISKYFSTPNHEVVDSEILEPEDENDYQSFMRLNGKRYNGIALDFDGVFCTGELLYIRGWLDSQVSYYTNGNLEAFELIEDGFSQVYQWYENEMVKKIEISAQNQFSVNLTMNPDGRISVLGLDGGCLNQMSLVSDRLKFPFIKEKLSASKIKAADSLVLSGSDITDDLIYHLIANKAFERTRKICFFKTNLTQTGLLHIRQERAVKKLIIKSKFISESDTQAFKASRPDCYVEHIAQCFINT